MYATATAPRGLIIVGGLVLVIAVDLSAIASVGSACSLLSFLLVGVAGYRRRGETGSRTPVVLAAIGVTAIVLGFFAVGTLRNEPETLAAIVAIALLSTMLDFPLEAQPPAQARPSMTAGRSGVPPPSG